MYTMRQMLKLITGQTTGREYATNGHIWCGTVDHGEMAVRMIELVHKGGVVFFASMTINDQENVRPYG